MKSKKHLIAAARALAKDAEHWITVHPNGKEHKGSPVLINGAGQIIGGAGGKLTGKFVKPKTKSEGRAGTEAQHAPAIWLGPPSNNPPTHPVTITMPGETSKPTEQPKPVEPPKAAEQPKPVSKRAPFKPAKNSKEAAKWAVENDLADHAEFGKLNVNVANAGVESLHRHLEEFPELRKNSNFLGSIQSRSEIVYQKRKAVYEDKCLKLGYSPDEAKRSADRFISKERAPQNCWAYASYGEYGNAVAFNEVYGAKRDLSALEWSLKRNVENKHHPIGCDTLKSVFDHEYGHQLDNLLNLRKNPDVLALRASLQKKETESLAGMTMREQYEHHKANGDVMTNEVSKYAKENMAEFIAECWAEANNNPNPRPTAKRLAEIVRAEYAKQFGK